MIGIIGGSGLYNAEFIYNPKEQEIETKYGKPSAPIKVGVYTSKNVAFLPRHGIGHKLNPTNVNYRANIMALKKVGVNHIIAVNAVGSLKKEIEPGTFVIPDHFIDFTKKREYTFYDEDKVCHINVSDPFCEIMRNILIDGCNKLSIPYKDKGTCAVIEGPRFSTRAESAMYRNYADVIGMTLVPEATLAREAELCYASVCVVSDYDNLGETAVSTEEVLSVMKQNDDNVMKLLKEVIPKIPKERVCLCKDALKGALI
ncbi:MAG: S-methyl-5'-thioadenosine phosphorylase [Candidatus Diapherotrites archaeon]